MDLEYKESELTIFKTENQTSKKNWWDYKSQPCRRVWSSTNLFWSNKILQKKRVEEKARNNDCWRIWALRLFW